MDLEKYTKHSHKEEMDVTAMSDKELDTGDPYITTPSESRSPRASLNYQPVSSPPAYPTNSLDANPVLDNDIARYTTTQTKRLSILSAVHSFLLAWWIIAIILGIYYTPVQEDYDPNEHGSSAAFQTQLKHFRIALIGGVPAVLISLGKLVLFKRIFKSQRVSEESRRLAADIDGNYSPGSGGYGNSRLLIGKWWEGYFEQERAMQLVMHLFGMILTIWLAVGKFRGYIRPRGPFDDAICAFSDPRAYGGTPEPTH
ncbi:hypothetical protein TWF730_007079 [Orbilia blumenaviensis]|uniref:Uncharacterized protein n=1 Tax=Orbilia blumenaviensis TaxID=1796055 RepID=A0AAV9VIF8_9PEZI